MTNEQIRSRALQVLDELPECASEEDFVQPIIRALEEVASMRCHFCRDGYAVTTDGHLSPSGQFDYPCHSEGAAQLAKEIAARK